MLNILPRAFFVHKFKQIYRLIFLTIFVLFVIQKVWECIHFSARLLIYHFFIFCVWHWLGVVTSRRPISAQFSYTRCGEPLLARNIFIRKFFSGIFESYNSFLKEEINGWIFFCNMSRETIGILKHFHPKCNVARTGALCGFVCSQIGNSLHLCKVTLKQV